jgi:N-acetylmuramoyl-L-alanine amidase
LLILLGALKKTHTIPAANFIGHSDIAPTRKVDPNITFPWKTLAEKGYGLWYGDTSKITVPQNFNNIQALRIIGYDVRDTSAAIGAFKRHFLTQENKTLSEADRKILYDLSRKYQ